MSQQLMKDGLGPTAIKRINHALAQASYDFPEWAFTSDIFIKDALQGLEDLELKARVNHLIHVLHAHFPESFETTAALLQHLPMLWDKGDETDPLSGFAAWPLIDYVGVHGLNHPELSLNTLKQLTPMFSAEFAVRPYLIKHFKQAYAKMLTWCHDEDHHVRRLATEGIRPRLPWGQRLPQFIQDPIPVLELLEKLKDDPSEYVRRSVANNLNDISKDHPDLVIKACRKWSENASADRQWIIRHATRGLVKSGHPEVFGLLGFTEKPELKISQFRLNKSAIRLGEKLEIKIGIQSTSKQNQHIVIDYALHHVKANGETSAKVFKLKNLKIKASETLQIQKSHSLKKITTRKYYAGQHAIELFINGKARKKLVFDLSL